MDSDQKKNILEVVGQSSDENFQLDILLYFFFCLFSLNTTIW